MRASRFYFDKPLEDLSWLQAAFLAGLPQSPGRMNPHHPKGLARALRRAHRILALLKSRTAQCAGQPLGVVGRSEEHTSELQSHLNLVCRLLLEKKKKISSAPARLPS